MSLERLRRWSRLVAAVLVVAMCGGVPHLRQDDLACAPSGAGPFEGHEETDHQLAPAGSPAHDDHCAICHWSRSLRSPLAETAAWAPGLPPALRVHRDAPRAFAAPALDSLPARAPPSAL